MSFGPAGYSQVSLLARAPNAASLDPALSEQHQRRRALWSFLTWAFLLAEASRDAQADASASHPLGDPDWQSVPVKDQTGAAAPLPDDEPAPKDWSIPRSAETSEASLGSHGLLGLPGLTRFDAPERLADAGEPAVRSASSGGGGSPIRVVENDAGVDIVDVRDEAGADNFFASGLDVGLDLAPADDLTVNLLARLPLDLDDAQTVLPFVGEVTAVVTQTTGGLLGLTTALSGDVLASGGSIEHEATSSKIDLSLDHLFTGDRYTDYHLALQLEPIGVRGIEATTAGSTVDTHALDLLIPHVEPDHAPSGDHGGVAPVPGLPSLLDDLAHRSGADLLM